MKVKTLAIIISAIAITIFSGICTIIIISNSNKSNNNNIQSSQANTALNNESKKKNEVNSNEENVKDKSNTSKETDTTSEFGKVNTKYIDSFGKKVEGYNVDGTWRLFYADSNSAYLIRDSIGIFALEKLPGYETSTISTLGQKLNSQFKNWTLKNDEGDLNINIKAVAALLDPAKWEDYAEKGVATWAVGAPTLELFVASYNATHTIQIECTVESSDSRGYKVNKNGGEYLYDVSELDDGSNLDEMYFPIPYWIASPGEGPMGTLSYMFMGAMGYYGGALVSDASGKYVSKSIGIRPVVSVPIERIGNGLELK